MLSGRRGPAGAPRPRAAPGERHDPAGRRPALLLRRHALITPPPRCAASRESLPSGTQSRIVPTTAIPGGKPMARLPINGKTLEVNVNPSTPLLWAIREQVGLTGTKYGCGIAQCGACTVHLDGAAVRSCVMPVADAEGKKITTIEGLANGGALHKVQKAWLDKEGPPCGYCPSGMIIAGGAPPQKNPQPTPPPNRAAETHNTSGGDPPPRGGGHYP